eukprot:99157_1
MQTLCCLLYLQTLRAEIQSWSSWGNVPKASDSLASGSINNEYMYIFYEDGSIYKKNEDTPWTSVNPPVSVEIACHLSKCSTTINDQFIYILQHQYDEPRVIYVFDTSIEEWLPDVISIPVEVGGACLTSDKNNYIYIATGYDENSYPDTLYIIQIYDIKNKVWCNYNNTNLLYSSYYPGCVYYDESVYLFGGYEDGLQDKIQIFDIKTKQWEYNHFAKLLTGTIQMRTIIGNDNLIYIMGGFTDLSGADPSNLVQVYDPSTDQMLDNAAVSLQYSRAAFVSEIVNSKIVVCSGKDGDFSTSLVSCEISNMLTSISPSPPSTVVTGICSEVSGANAFKYFAFVGLLFEMMLFVSI